MIQRMNFIPRKTNIINFQIFSLFQLVTALITSSLMMALKRMTMMRTLMLISLMNLRLMEVTP